MKVGDVVKIKELDHYTYGGEFKRFLLNWNNVNRGTISRIEKDSNVDKITVTQNNFPYMFIEQELEIINWLKII